MTAVETLGGRLRRLRLATPSPWSPTPDPSAPGFVPMSQRDLAEPGITYAYISRIEAGSRDPSVKALRRIAPKLGVTVEYLETGAEPVGRLLALAERALDRDLHHLATLAVRRARRVL